MFAPEKGEAATVGAEAASVLQIHLGKAITAMYRAPAMAAIEVRYES